ncbi:MAG: DUF433 domain-containing protein [bacterium]|nr:DUF433 domain-containing protein [bacterium]
MSTQLDMKAATDPRDLPVYTVADAARYLHMSPSTLRSWVLGRRYPAGGGERFFEPLIQLSEPGTPLLSFLNLVEAHVLLAIRTRHRVPMREVRAALDYAQEKENIDRLLIREELRAAPGELFLTRYGELLSLTRAGQLAIKTVLFSYLERLERDVTGLPDLLYPFIPGYSGDRTLLISPRISFGRPVIARRGISAAALVDRFDAGEQLDEIARDYDLEVEEVEKALTYEQAA